MNKDKFPSLREAAILAVLINGERYGREIRNECQERTGQRVSLGTLYVLLSRMEEAGLVIGRTGETTEARRDHRRKYFRITGMGQAALSTFEQYIIGAIGERL